VAGNVYEALLAGRPIFLLMLQSVGYFMLLVTIQRVRQGLTLVHTSAPPDSFRR
jgi:hypothetical protein